MAAEVAEVPGVGPRRAEQLAAQGVTSRAELMAERGRLELPSPTRRFLGYDLCRAIPAATAKAVLSELRRRLAFGEGRYQVWVVGSARRERPVLKDLDLLVVAPPEVVLARGPSFLSTSVLAPAVRGDRAELVDTFAGGPRRRTLLLAWRPPATGERQLFGLDLFAATPAELPYALYHYTGSQAYNVRSRMAAKRRGWRLNQYGLFVGETCARAPGSEKIRTEAALAKFLGLTPRPPCERNR